MQLIPADHVRKWQKIGELRAPSSISTVCPHCGEKVVFALSDNREERDRMAISATARCPGCHKNARFWSVRDERSPKTDVGNPAAVFMYPPARNHYPSPDLGSDVPEQLRQALLSTIDAFNAGNYTATAVCGRRTLEGIFKNLISAPKRSASLAELIEQVKKEVDLARPLTGLSHAIRNGGNLGAHFDMEKEPDSEMARQMIELLDYLITYLYILPKKIKKLEDALGK